MSLAILSIGYIGTGIVLGIIAAIAKRPSPTDAFLVVVMWPLYAPFLLLGGSRSSDSREAELIDALSRASRSPLAAMLPDADSARVLGRPLREAGTRLVELDELLARPDFDPATAEKRAGELTARGATAAAATAQLRVKTLAQLQTVRHRYRQELDEVAELIAQLVTQAELVRLEPSAQNASRDLVRELVERVEGLGELFAAHDEIA